MYPQLSSCAEPSRHVEAAWRPVFERIGDSTISVLELVQGLDVEGEVD